MDRGPLEVLVIGFPQDHLPEGVEAALDALRQGAARSGTSC